MFISSLLLSHCRYSKSSVKDMRINMALSAVFSLWVLIQQNAEWKPLQFLAFIFFYRIFEKLKAFEPAVSPTLDVSHTYVVWLNEEQLSGKTCTARYIPVRQLTGTWTGRYRAVP
ncbi:hypothetical protein BHM03_00054041, partial [Ensete ventricosum]